MSRPLAFPVTIRKMMGFESLKVTVLSSCSLLDTMQDIGYCIILFLLFCFLLFYGGCWRVKIQLVTSNRRHKV